MISSYGKHEQQIRTALGGWMVIVRESIRERSDVVVSTTTTTMHVNVIWRKGHLSAVAVVQHGV